MNLDPLIRAVQQKVGVDPDGAPGPKTWKAIYAAVFGAPYQEGKLDQALGAVDPRSEKNIATLLSEVRPYARALIHAAAKQGIEIKVISGTRTYEEQNALYEQGRTKPGEIVTNARAGFSNHNFGIAFDVGVFQGAKYIPDSPAYAAVGAIGQSLGIEWGGNFVSFVDQPHFQIRPPWARHMTEKQMLAELRERRESGVRVFA